MAGFYAQRGLDPDKMYQDMKERMDAEGLAYGKRTHSYNSRLAQELGKWSETVEGGEKLESQFYKAYFVDAKNIGKTDILLECVEAAGLYTEDAKFVIDNRTFKKAVDDDWAKSRQYGITGVPTYVAGGYGVVGAQPYEVLEKLVQEAGVKRHT